MKAEETYYPKQLSDEDSPDKPTIASPSDGTPRVEVQVRGDKADVQDTHDAIEATLRSLGAAFNQRDGMENNTENNDEIEEDN